MSLRRILAVLFVVAFGLGAVLHGVQASDMTLKMAPMTAADGLAPSGCDKCGGDDDMAAKTCDVMCAGFVAVAPADSEAKALLPPILAAVPPSSGAGRNGPPEPYPPKAS